MNTSESIANISAALVAALGEMTDIKKGREANTGKFSYTYADLADTLQSVRPVLAAHQLAVMQTAHSATSDAVLISTTLLHASGEWIEFAPLAMPCGRTPQEAGSAISYGRRYHLLASLGLAAEDDDGATATTGARKQAKPGNRAPAARTTTASAEPRTSEERIIRDLLGNLPKVAATDMRAAFVGKFGVSLSMLDPAEHPNALAWVEDRLRNMQEGES